MASAPPAPSDEENGESGDESAVCQVCPVCTFADNGPMAVVCLMCNLKLPDTQDPCRTAWICNKCTLVNAGRGHVIHSVIYLSLLFEYKTNSCICFIKPLCRSAFIWLSK